MTALALVVRAREALEVGEFDLAAFILAELERDLAGQPRDDVQAAWAIFDARWEHWRPPDWQARIRYWVRHGLDLDDIEEAIEVAQWKRRHSYWRYFAGVCWTKLRERGRDEAEGYLHCPCCRVDFRWPGELARHQDVAGHGDGVCP